MGLENMGAEEIQKVTRKAMTIHMEQCLLSEGDFSAHFVECASQKIKS
jgi:hypothetical protein